jgi:hypothetical protein
MLGVQIRNLDDVIGLDLQSSTIVAVAKLEHNPFRRYDNELDVHYQERIYPLTKKLAKVHTQYYHDMYQVNPFRLFGSLYPRCLSCMSCCCGKHWVFCSEFVAIVYQAVGIYSKLVHPDEIVPVMLIMPELYKESIPIPTVLKKLIYLNKI